MDDGSKREIGGTNTWVWDPNETGEKSDSGIPWLNVEYYSNEVGSYTWSTSIYWRGWEFTGTGWRYIGGISAIDTNNFTVAQPGGCL